MRGDELVRTLEKGGWRTVRQKGSHRRLENPDRRQNSITVAIHAGQDVPAGTLGKILRHAGLSREQFEALRKA